MTAGLSNPYSSGGGGLNFENSVQSMFALLMILGNHCPCHPNCEITHIKLQGKHLGFDTDDCIIFSKHKDTLGIHKLLCQIKHSVSVTRDNPTFSAVINSAWADFNKPVLFDRRVDDFALITGPLSKTDILDTRFILEWARTCNSSSEFFDKVYTSHLSSNNKQDKLEAFRANVNSANGNIPVVENDLWRFLQRFHLWGLDLDVYDSIHEYLLKSVMRRACSNHNVMFLWEKLVYTIGVFDRTAGTVSLDSLPPDLVELFDTAGEKADTGKTLGAVPTKPKIFDKFELNEAAAVANLIGAWREDNSCDLSMIEAMISTKIDNWLSHIREIHQVSKLPFSYNNGIWTIADRRLLWESFSNIIYMTHLNKFKNAALDVLIKIDPLFTIQEDDERPNSELFGNRYACSEEIRLGLSETLAMIGNAKSGDLNCDIAKARSIANEVLSSIFENATWELWLSLNDVIYNLAESAPLYFIDIVSRKISSNPEVFRRYFETETPHRTYLTGLLCALERLAWLDDHLVQVSDILASLCEMDPGGHFANRPINSLKEIHIPWIRNTLATMATRKRAITVLIGRHESVAWKLMFELISGMNMSSGTSRPHWALDPALMLNDNDRRDPEEQLVLLDFYEAKFIEMSFNNITWLSESFKLFNKLNNESVKKIITHIKECLSELTSEEKSDLHNSVRHVILRIDSYPDVFENLSRDTIEIIKKLANQLSPSNPFENYKEWFTRASFSMHSLMHTLNYSEILFEKQKETISNILDEYGIEKVVEFVSQIDLQHDAGIALSFYANNTTDQMIVSMHVKAGENYHFTQFIKGYAVARTYHNGTDWLAFYIQAENDDVRLSVFLSYLPFRRQTWELLSKNVKDDTAYWKSTDVNYQNVLDDDLRFVIGKLVSVNRGLSAVRCIFMILKKYDVDNDLIILALQSISEKSSDDELMLNDNYLISELIKHLEERLDSEDEELFKIEWQYFELIMLDNKIPRSIEKRINDSPDFFCMLVKMLYKSNKEKAEDENINEEITERFAKRAWRILDSRKSIPGYEVGYKFNFSRFQEWLENVKNLCVESGHLEPALSEIGKVLIYAPADEDGLWIHRDIAKLLDDPQYSRMLRSYQIAILNSRGVYWVDNTGQSERDLSRKYNSDADGVEAAGYLNLAKELRLVAQKYENESYENHR